MRYEDYKEQCSLWWARQEYENIIAFFAALPQEEMTYERYWEWSQAYLLLAYQSELDSVEAYALTQKALEMLLPFEGTLPTVGNARWYERVGELYQLGGQPKRALYYFHKALALTRRNAPMSASVKALRAKVRTIEPRYSFNERIALVWQAFLRNEKRFLASFRASVETLKQSDSKHKAKLFLVKQWWVTEQAAERTQESPFEDNVEFGDDTLLDESPSELLEEDPFEERLYDFVAILTDMVWELSLEVYVDAERDKPMLIFPLAEGKYSPAHLAYIKRTLPPSVKTRWDVYFGRPPMVFEGFQLNQCAIEDCRVSFSWFFDAERGYRRCHVTFHDWVWFEAYDPDVSIWNDYVKEWDEKRGCICRRYLSNEAYIDRMLLKFLNFALGEATRQYYVASIRLEPSVKDGVKTYRLSEVARLFPTRFGVRLKDIEALTHDASCDPRVAFLAHPEPNDQTGARDGKTRGTDHDGIDPVALAYWTRQGVVVGRVLLGLNANIEHSDVMPSEAQRLLDEVTQTLLQYAGLNVVHMVGRGIDRHVLYWEVLSWDNTAFMEALDKVERALGIPLHYRILTPQRSQGSGDGAETSLPHKEDRVLDERYWLTFVKVISLR